MNARFLFFGERYNEQIQSESCSAGRTISGAGRTISGGEARVLILALMIRLKAGEDRSEACRGCKATLGEENRGGRASWTNSKTPVRDSLKVIMWLLTSFINSAFSVHAPINVFCTK